MRDGGGGGRRTTKDAGRRLFFGYVRLMDAFGRRTYQNFLKADGGQTPSVRIKDGFGCRTVKLIFMRTDTDGGQTPLVRLKDEFGRRTGKISKKRTEADAGRRRTKSVRLALENIMKIEIFKMLTILFLHFP